MTYLLKLIFLAAMLFLNFSCDTNKGTSTGNPLINLRYASFSSSLSMMAVSQTKLCFKRLRFKQAGEPTNSDPEIDEDNIDFSIGEKTLNSSGDNLGDVSVPAGTYSRIEIDLDDHCGNGYSVSVVNSSGTFATNDRISMKFQGHVTITGSASLELILQNLITELNSVTNSSQIKSRLESVSGAF